jgi:hypothetical protein
MDLTLPEELLLLMLDDESGRLHEGAAPSGDFALVGAILAELTLAGRISAGATTLTVTNPAPTGDPLFDRVLAQLAAETRARETRHWIELLGADAEAYREALFGRLVQKGVLRREEGRFLWVFPERRYPAVSGREEREVKARLLGVLFHDDTPGHRDALLIGLCRAAGLFALILAPHELERLEPRIEQIANLEELNRCLSDAIREIYAQIARYVPMV